MKIPSLIFLLFGFPLFAQDFNLEILDILKTMPQGGEYAHSLTQKQEVIENLNSSFKGKNSEFSFDLGKSKGPSFCSSAVAAVIYKFIERHPEYFKTMNANFFQELQNIGRSQEVLSGALDGRGFFGHINSDGPGLAVLFRKLKIGQNFLLDPNRSFEKAKAGDFLKIFWNDKIGKGEQGHLVVYLGESPDHKKIRIWSSNSKNEDGSSGYGEMWVDKSKINKAVFSRIETPKNFSNWATLPEAQKKDRYLIELTKRSSSLEEMENEIRTQSTSEESKTKQFNFKH